VPKLESRSGHVRKYIEHRRLEIGRFWQFLEMPEKKPWRKGSISRVGMPYRSLGDTAPLREEKREVSDHLYVR
jgi:hypothetical protein